MKIEFTKDFAGHKKGDTTEKLTKPLASRLVGRGVAKVWKAKPKKTKSKK